MPSSERKQNGYFPSAWLREAGATLRAAGRFSIIILLALAFVLGLVSLLNQFKFRTSLQSVTERRLSLITQDLRDSIEAGLDLGLVLKDFEGARALLSRAGALDDGVEFIHVYAPDGRILHSTEPGAIDQSVDPAWLAAQKQSASGAWRRVSNGAIVLGRRLDSSVGATAGGLALVYPLEGIAESSAALLSELTSLTALTLLGFSLLGALASLFVARRLQRVYAALARAIDGDASGQTRLLAPLLDAAQRFHANVSRAHAELAAIEGAAKGDATSAATLAAAETTQDVPIVAEEPAALTRMISRLRTGMMIATLVLMVAAATVLSIGTHRLFLEQFGPELDRQGSTVAHILAADVERALGFGIKVGDLVGVAEHFEKARAPHPEIDYVALHAKDGSVLYSSGVKAGAAASVRELLAKADQGGADAEDNAKDDERDLVLQPVRDANGVAGALVVGLNAAFVKAQMQERAYDVLTVLLVAVIIAFELLALMTGRLLSPLRGLYGLLTGSARGRLGLRSEDVGDNDAGEAIGKARQALDQLRARYARVEAAVSQGSVDLLARVKDVGRRFDLDAAARAPGAAEQGSLSVFDVRLPLFLFVFAEELQKSFLPLYIKELFEPVDWLSPVMLMGLPISAYMLALALITPVAGSWVDRFGERGVFMTGLVPAIAGFVASSAAATLYQLIGARVLTAIGYAMITIAAQGYISAATAREGRAQGMSSFVGVLMAASICGTAIGGVLSDLIGYRQVFLLAATLAGLAGLMASQMLAARSDQAVKARPKARLADFARLFANRRFMVLLVLAAIPAKIVLTGFLFYSAPLLLAELGATEAETGRVMMVYSLVIIALGPWASRLADRRNLNWHLVFIGSLMSGLAMIGPVLAPGFYGVLASVFLLAVGHALSISPQIALIPSVCGAEIERIGQTSVLGMLRTLERVGSVIGPLLAAGMAARFGFLNGLATIGAVIALLSLPLLAALPRKTLASKEAA